MAGTVAAGFSKKVQQRLNAHASSSAQCPPLSAPSPFAPPAGNMADAFQQSPPPSHPGPSNSGKSSPFTNNSQPSVFASPTSGSSFLQAHTAATHPSGGGAAPSADPNAQWSMFASGSGLETPQQYMFPDTRQTENMWGEPSDFHQPQSRPHDHQRQGSSFNQGYAVQSEGLTAPFNASMFSLSGLNDFASTPSEFGLGAGSFIPGPSPFWPGATVVAPNPAMGELSGSTSPNA